MWTTKPINKKFIESQKKKKINKVLLEKNLVHSKRLPRSLQTMIVFLAAATVHYFQLFTYKLFRRTTSTVNRLLFVVFIAMLLLTF